MKSRTTQKALKHVEAISSAIDAMTTSETDKHAIVMTLVIALAAEIVRDADSFDQVERRVGTVQQMLEMSVRELTDIRKSEGWPHGRTH